jgi:hypothetical protein
MNPAAIPPPQFGSRRYTITPAGLCLVEEVHQFKPGPGEDETALLLRIARAIGLPVAVEIRYQQGRISVAEARRMDERVSG